MVTDVLQQPNVYTQALYLKKFHKAQLLQKVAHFEL